MYEFIESEVKEEKCKIETGKGTKPKFMLMGSCQNLAYYLSVCSLTTYVGNLVIHCSSLSENMHSKCSIFCQKNMPMCL